MINRYIKVAIIFCAIYIIPTLGASSIFANRIFDNPDNKPYWGARISYLRLYQDLFIYDLKYSDGEYYDFFSPGKGVSIGGIFHLPITANFFFEPGLSFNLGKFNIKSEVFIGENKELLQNGGILKQNSVYYNSFKLPLVIGYHLDFFKNFNLSLYQGPLLNFVLNMDAKIKIEKDGKIHETNTSLFKPYPSMDDDYLRRFNMQWRFGASLNFKQYMVGVNIDGDMTNLLRVSNYNRQFYEGSLNTWEMFLTLGYNFK